MWDAIKLVMSSIWIWLKPVLMYLLKEIGKDIMQVVERVIREVSLEEMTNEEKRCEAFDRIKEILRQEGKVLADSTLNLLIELVYQKIKRD